MYIYIYIYMYIYRYLFMYIYIHTCTYINIYICTYIYTYIVVQHMSAACRASRSSELKHLPSAWLLRQVNIYTSSTYIYVFMYLCIYTTYIYIFIYIYIYMYINLYVYIELKRLPSAWLLRQVKIYMPITHIYVNIYLFR
jgi:hypothetical protein